MPQDRTGDTYVKLFRRIREWEWYTDGNTFRVFVHLLLGANWEPKKWRGHVIRRGQISTGRRTLAKELNLSEQQIRTALTHLQDAGEIAIQSTREFSLITLINYDADQGDSQQEGQMSTNHDKLYNGNNGIKFPDAPTHPGKAESPIAAGVFQYGDAESNPPPTHHQPTPNDPKATHLSTHLEGQEKPMAAAASVDTGDKSNPPINPPKKSALSEKSTTTKEERIYIDTTSEKSEGPEKKKKTLEYGSDDPEYMACLWLIAQIKSIHPTAKVPNTGSARFFKWCDTLRFMHERDKRSWEDFHRIVEFMRDDIRFWSTILLSADGVRRNWDRAWAQYEQTSRTQDYNAEWSRVVRATSYYGPNRKADALNSLGEKISKAVERIGYQRLCGADNINQYKGEFLRACTQG